MKPKHLSFVPNAVRSVTLSKLRCFCVAKGSTRVNCRAAQTSATTVDTCSHALLWPFRLHFNRSLTHRCLGFAAGCQCSARQRRLQSRERRHRFVQSACTSLLVCNQVLRLLRSSASRVIPNGARVETWFPSSFQIMGAIVS